MQRTNGGARFTNNKKIQREKEKATILKTCIYINYSVHVIVGLVQETFRPRRKAIVVSQSSANIREKGGGCDYFA